MSLLLPLLTAFLPIQDTPAPRQVATGTGGVFPSLTVMAPGAGSDSEAGIGALVPWADRLWAVGYVAHKRGSGLGLYAIDEEFAMERHPHSVTGTYANRFVHWPSEQAFIGPHVISAEGEVRTIEPLIDHRLAATMRHLTQPQSKVYFLTMEGLFFEVDVQSLAVQQLFDLKKELSLGKVVPHFKSAHTAQGRVVVANNSYDEPEHQGHRKGGRLAEWDGESRWRILEQNPFVEVAGKQSGTAFGDVLYALGWDRASPILRVLDDGTWTRYRLPRASHAFDHAWTTEWMRIREAQTERYLMDAFGMFYELPALTYDGRVWGVRPIATHLSVVPDFCHWRGLFVMASDQTDHAVGQPQSGFSFGAVDDLWRMGKPTGWGGPWWNTSVEAAIASDPFLMTGFDKKVVHLSHESEVQVEFRIEVDFLGDGTWKTYASVEVPPDGYEFLVFPDGYAAHWVRLVPSQSCLATAIFVYS